MAAPQTRDEFAQHCLRKLGEPVIRVNVDVQHVEDRIDDALSRFYEFSNIGSEEVFILHDITAPTTLVETDSAGDAVLDSAGDEIPILDSNGDEQLTSDGTTDTELGYIQLPNDMVSVTNVFRPAYASGIGGGGANFEFYVDSIYRNLMPGSAVGGISYYYMYQSQLTLLNRFFNPEKSYNYNEITNKLIVAGGLKDSDRQYGGLIIRGYRKLHGEEKSSDPTDTTYHNIWKNRWLQEYAAALIKRQWATNLSKYQSVQLVGGVQMNGDVMWSQAIEEIENLEKELRDTYELPPRFFMG